MSLATATPPVSEPTPAVTRSAPPLGPRLFYPLSAVAMIALMFLGFQQYYLHGKAFPDREIAPPAKVLTLLHGSAMTGWVLLLALQSVLIFGRQRKVHAALGMLGALLVAGIVYLGMQMALMSARFTPPQVRIWGFTPRQFMAVPVISICVFAIMVGIGVWYRRRPAVHRPMMVLATLMALDAAIARIEPISVLYRGTVWETFFGPFFGMLVIGAALLLLGWGLTRKFDRWFAAGLAALVLVSAGIVQLAPTGAWASVSGWLLQ